jgi:acyl-CoA thioesterase 8
VIAQCLAAAQRTVPLTFTVHSMHCYFVLAGDSETPIIYYVERVRSGRSFATRTVQARQRGKPIFTTTMSFTRDGSGGEKTVNHAVPLPDDVLGPWDDEEDPADVALRSPFVSQRIPLKNPGSSPHQQRPRQWIRARGTISEDGGHQEHISALAYMSDSYFIGTVARVHDLWRGWPEQEVRVGPKTADSDGTAKATVTAGASESTKNGDGVEEFTVTNVEKAFKSGEEVDINSLRRKFRNKANRPVVGMMVSLDHTIYFHNPRAFKADQWMFTEMETPWSGDGRGLVFQKMYSRDGLLIATCVQEVSARESKTPIEEY